jgi:chromosome segregation ATPase
MLMDSKNIEELLIQLLQDLAVVKNKLDSIEEIKIDAKSMNQRIDKLEAQNEKHESKLKSVENRCNTVEKYLRDNLQDQKKTLSNTWISVGLAIFSVVVSVVINMLI